MPATRTTNDAEAPNALLIPDIEGGSTSWGTDPTVARSSLQCCIDFTAGDTQILHNLSAEFSPGCCTALMGPSGAGKTTLLNALCGRATYGTVEGEILENGVPLVPADFKRRFTYVPQEDVLWSALTVRELLTYTAQMRFDEPAGQLTERVDAVMHSLSLTERADVKIGDDANPSLSGGQKKRVSIAMELLADRPVLFLDEPTSGLDSVTAHEVCELVCDLAKQHGKTIICTIHQPTFATLLCFSKLLVLAKGRVVYDGQPDGIIDYMALHKHPAPGHVNPIDHFFDLISHGTTPEIKEATAISWATSWQEQPTVSPRRRTIPNSTSSSSTYPISKTAQTWHLLKRALYLWIVDPSQFRACLVPQLLITLVMGCSFFNAGLNKNNGETLANGIFVLVFSTFMTNMMMTIVVIPSERSVVKREYLNGMYSLSCFWIARVIQAAVQSFLLQAICGTIGYFLLGLPANAERFSMFYLATSLLATLAGIIALVIGCSVPNAQSAVQRAPGPMILFMLYAGLLIPKSDMKPWFIWVYHINMMHYCYSIVMYYTCNGQGDFVTGTTVRQGDVLLEHFSIHEEDLDLAWGVLIGLVLLVTFIGYYTAKFNFRK